MGVDDHDSELFEAIEALVSDGKLGRWSPAFGVAQKVNTTATIR